MFLHELYQIVSVYPDGSCIVVWMDADHSSAKRLIQIELYDTFLII